jgi:putative tryptophan/tyrosine transport system substrate-binding protein
LSGLLFASIHFAEAQHTAGKVVRIGYLGINQSPSTLLREKAFVQELGNLGWIEGQNSVIERRYWENRAERLSALAAEMIRLNVNVIVTTSGTAAHALKKATSTIPIVMTS